MAKTPNINLVQVEINKEQFESCKRMLSGIENGTRSMLSMAINKVVPGAKTDVKKAVGQEINLKQVRIAEDIRTKKATKLDLSASIYSRGTKVELVEFGARVIKGGVSYQVAKSGGRKTMPGGFLAQGSSSGNLHVMKRLDHVGTGKPIGQPGPGMYFSYPAAWGDEYSYPAHIRYGPSIPEVWGKPLVLADTLKKADSRLATEIDRATTKLLADAAKGTA